MGKHLKNVVGIIALEIKIKPTRKSTNHRKIKINIIKQVPFKSKIPILLDQHPAIS
jgi:hypothetical protein